MRRLLIMFIVSVMLVFSISSLASAANTFTAEEETLLANYISGLEAQVQKLTIERDAFKKAYEQSDNMNTEYGILLKQMAENRDKEIKLLEERITLIQEKLTLSEKKVDILTKENEKLKKRINFSTVLNEILGVALLVSLL